MDRMIKVGVGLLFAGGVVEGGERALIFNKFFWKGGWTKSIW